MAATFRNITSVLCVVPGLTGCGPGPQWDVNVGRGVADQVQAEMGVMDDTALEAYVASVGQRLVSQLDDSPFRYTFTLVDEPSPNAFSVPGGRIFVTRGLLAWLNDEDELAGVLGHEIMHVERRHTAKRFQQAFIPGVLTVPGMVVGDVVNRDLGELMASPFVGVGQILLAGYSRDNEREADRLGMELVAAAGYDPKGMVRFLEGMNRYEQWVGNATIGPYLLQTHPRTSQRVAATAARSVQMARPRRTPISPDRAEFLGRLDGMVVAENPMEGVLVGSWFVHPDAGLSLRLPRDWFYLHNRRMIAAMPATQDALLFYDPPTPGDDPALDAARLRRQLAEVGIEPDIDEPTTINGLRAYRIRAELGNAAEVPYYLDVTWYAVGGFIQRQVALAPSSYLDQVEAAAESFGRITPMQRAWVTVRKLRIVPAKRGESVRQAVTRLNTPWHPDKVAALNGLDVDTPLPADRPIKVVLVERYEPGPWRPMFEQARAVRPAPGEDRASVTRHRR